MKATQESSQSKLLVTVLKNARQNCRKPFLKKMNPKLKNGDGDRSLELLKCRHWSHECNCVVCDLCGKSFLRKLELERHKNLVHETDKPFDCEQCHKSFAKQKYLDVHKRSTHQTEKSFYCDLNLIVATHVNERLRPSPR